MIGITLYLSICVSNIGFCCDFHIESWHFFFHTPFFFQIVGRGKGKHSWIYYYYYYYYERLLLLSKLIIIIIIIIVIVVTTTTTTTTIIIIIITLIITSRTLEKFHGSCSGISLRCSVLSLIKENLRCS